jgi:integrase/recombinase XerD
VTEAIHGGPSALDSALDRYLGHLKVERGLLSATLEAYARDLREYTDWLGQQGIARLADVTEPTILQHLAALQLRGLSRASQARHLAAVRGLHKFANAEGLAPTDPSEGVGATRG